MATKKVAKKKVVKNLVSKAKFPTFEVMCETCSGTGLKDSNTLCADCAGSGKAEQR